MQIVLSSAISAFEKGQQWQLALGLLAEMVFVKVDKDVITFNAAISACEKGHQWQLALGLRNLNIDDLQIRAILRMLESKF